MQLAINHGLGKKQAIVSSHDLSLFEKVRLFGRPLVLSTYASIPSNKKFVLKKQYIYIAQILLVVSIALSKLSIGLLFKSLMNRGITQWANWGLIGAIMAWAVGSIAALAARCSSPHPWSVVGGKCDQQVSEIRRQDLGKLGNPN